MILATNAGFSLAIEAERGLITAARLSWSGGKRPHGKAIVEIGGERLICGRAQDFRPQRKRIRGYRGFSFGWGRDGMEPPHNSMVLENSHTSNVDPGTTLTETFGFTATSGRLLVLGAIADNNAVSLTRDTAGYTNIVTSTYHGFADSSYKTAAGSETSAQWTLGASDDAQSAVLEYSGYDGGGIDKQASNDSGVNVSTLTAGPSADTTKANSLVLALACNSSHDGTQSWGASTNPTVTDVVTMLLGPAAGCQGRIASANLTATQTLTAQASMSVADQCHLWMANWGEAAGGTAMPVFHHHYRQMMGG